MNYRGLSLRDLQYVVAVAETRNFGRAARACATSQPTLSLQIRKVEMALGVAIFDRNRRTPTTTTAAGLVAVRHMRAILVEATGLLDATAGLAQPLTGPFRLGAIATVGPYLLRHAIAPIRRRYPELELLIREGLTDELVESLRAGDLDAVIVATPVPDRGLAMLPLFFEPFFLAAPSDHAALARSPVRVADLPREGLIVLEDGHCLREQAIGYCREDVGRRPTPPQAASLETLRHMVAAGAGFTLIPALAVQKGGTEMDEFVVYRGFAEQENVGRDVALVYRATTARSCDALRLAELLRDSVPDGMVRPGPPGPAAGLPREPTSRQHRR